MRAALAASVLVSALALVTAPGATGDVTRVALERTLERNLALDGAECFGRRGRVFERNRSEAGGYDVVYACRLHGRDRASRWALFVRRPDGGLGRIE